MGGWGLAGRVVEWFLGLVSGILERLWGSEDERSLPGPWGVPLLGYLPFLNPARLHLQLTELGQCYGPMYQMRLGEKRVVVICERGLIREALDRPELSGRPDSGLTAILAKGGLSPLSFRSAEEPGWELSRAIAADATKRLAASRSSRLEASVVQAVAQMERIIKGADGRALSSRGLLHPAMECVASALCFGRPARLGDPLLKHMGGEFDGILRDQSRIELLTFLPSLRWFYKADAERCLKRTAGLSRTVFHNLGRRPAAPVAAVRNLSEAVHAAAAERTSNGLLAESQMLEADLYEQASHTLSEGAQWLFVLLAAHPQVQERLHRALDIGVPEGRPASLADRPFLAYAEAVVWESLRFASNLPFAVPHTASRDVVVGGFRIPKGALVLPNLYAVNRSASSFPSPDAFQPERFLTKGGCVDAEAVGRCLPFSSGRRGCVGERLGRAALLLLLANVLKDWDLRLPKGARPDDILQPHASFSLFPRPHDLVFSKRRRTRSLRHSY